MRKKFILNCHSLSRIFYGKLLRNKPWNISKIDLLIYPRVSLGFALGEFLRNNRIELVPQFESHDVMHVLTGIGICLIDEIALKCYLLGNGRHSFYHLMTTVGGASLYPERIKYFKFYYLLGGKALPFYDVDFLHLLNEPLVTLRLKYKISFE